MGGCSPRPANHPSLGGRRREIFGRFLRGVYEFYNLGIGDPVPVSAASRLGIGDMLDAVIAHFPEHEAEEKEDERPRVAIVGKPKRRKIFYH